MAPSPASKANSQRGKSSAGAKLASTGKKPTVNPSPGKQAPTSSKTAKPSPKAPSPAKAKVTKSVKASVPAAQAPSKKVASLPKSAVEEIKASSARKPKPEAKVPVVAPLGIRKIVKPKRVQSGRVKSELLQGELPQSYGKDRLVAIPKDPEWAHMYWELSPETRASLPDAEGALRLRGFDTTGILFDGNNAPVALDIEVAPFARSWYVKLPYQGRIYTFEFGWIKPDGEWVGVARSLPVGFEPGMLGNQIGSEEWISIASDELFRAAAGLGEGEGIQDLIRRLREKATGSHAMGGAAWLTSWGSGMGHLELAPSSWAPSSMEFQSLPSSWSNTSIGSGVSWSGLSSGEFQPPKNRPKDFWLWVETELVLYGATEPDAQVTLMGRPLPLNPDGTFRVKFPFPHGTELKMDVRAVDRTGEQVREAKPAAKRWTD